MRPDMPKLAQAPFALQLDDQVPSGPEACLRRRRHIVWGSYDITGAGRSLSRCISNARRKPTRVSSPSHHEQGHCSDPKKILSFVTTG